MCGFQLSIHLSDTGITKPEPTVTGDMEISLNQIKSVSVYLRTKENKARG